MSVEGRLGEIQGDVGELKGTLKQFIDANKQDMQEIKDNFFDSGEGSMGMTASSITSKASLLFLAPWPVSGLLWLLSLLRRQ